LPTQYPPYRGVTSINFSPHLVAPFEKGGLRGISLKGWWVGKDLKRGGATPLLKVGESLIIYKSRESEYAD
jgi:hypothetical protein